MTDNNRNNFQQHVRIHFDNERFVLMCKKDFEETDQPIFDMILESLARRQVRVFKVDEHYIFGDSILEKQMFSSSALRKFLVGNDRIKTLGFRRLMMAPEASDIIGRFSCGLDSLELVQCQLDKQPFAYGVAVNVLGPNKIIMNDCFPVESYSTFLAPLLENPRLNVLHLTSCGQGGSMGDLEIVKAALT
jgi:hypothetical protein